MSSGQLRRLLASFRSTGCPAPAEPDWEPPCPTCRETDAILAETWRPLDWSSDSALVAEIQDGRYAVVEASGPGKGWNWRLEMEDGWETRVLVEGSAPSLSDALYAAERAAQFPDPITNSPKTTEKSAR